MKLPRPRILAGLIAALLVPHIVSAQTAIPAGTNAGAFNATSPNPTTYILNAGDTRSQNGGTDGVAFGTAGTAGTYTLTINGSLLVTGTGRAVRTANVSAAAGHIFNLNIGAAGVISAVNDDAVQGRFQNSGSFVFNVNNLGTIYSGPNLAANPTTVLATGQALDLASAIGGTVNNGSITNSTALLRADGHDAVRLGSNMTMNNYGIVLGNSVVNDSSNNNGFNSAPPQNSTAETFSTAEGVSFETANNSTLNNHGTIIGARHGVESAETATNITINNFAGGVIVGRNGSGVGFDATSASATNVIIVNDGEIRGDYAGAGHIIDRTGNPSFTNDGDGDGIDIDGAVTITNNGLIHSTGAGGFDSGGRANSAEGIAIGGGIIVNNATGIIRGADRGILVNNDANLNRSAVAAASVTNAGLIEGQNGYAIRFEGNFDDTITNTGTIIGNGAIPNPAGTVVRQDGLVDPANGTLDGVTYGPGSARFIRGDGSAIQTGEGNDTLNNSGTITGNNGRAINLEGGNDTLNISGGSAVVNGDINGGAGTNTMNLTLGVGNSFSYAGTISNFSTVDVQSGTTTLSGVSTNIGRTKLRAGGKLILNGVNRLNADSILELSGGYLKITGAGANGQTFASLTLNDNSIIDLDNNSSLTFNGLESYLAGSTLSILNYEDSVLPDYAIRFFGDLTSDTNFLALVAATTVDGATAEYQFDGQYTNVGLNFSAVPEPSTMGFGLVLLGLAGYRQRRAKATA